MEESEVQRVLDRARAGDASAVGELFERHRERLERMVSLRLDHRLHKRVDPGDVLQEVFLEATRRLEEYLRRPCMPFYLWLRFLACQRLQALYRVHLGSHMRDVRREVPIADLGFPEATSEALAVQLMGTLTTPSQAAMRAEMKSQIASALESMDPSLREVIALRHFEDLSNAEAAQILALDESTASKRYIRGLKRLREILGRISGLSGIRGR